MTSTPTLLEVGVHGYLLAAGLLTGLIGGTLATLKLNQWLGPPDPVAGPSLIIYVPLVAGFLLGLLPAAVWAQSCNITRNPGA